MSLKIVLIIAALVGVIILALFGQAIAKTGITSIAQSDSVNCEKGICTSCMYNGESCSCDEKICSCANETVSKERCSIGGV